MSEDVEQLVEAARAVKDRAYAPYSDFHVGAALRGTDGRVFTGCNVENASYPVTVCAERVALGAAVAAGSREFDRIVVATDAESPTPPCGMCRQALSEFGLELIVLSVGQDDTRSQWRLAELLPAHFELNRRREQASDA